MIKRVASLLIGLILFGLGLVGLVTSQPKMYYPQIRIEVPDQTGAFAIGFLFRALPGLERCEALTGKVSRTVLASCAQCRVSVLKCLTGIDDVHASYLSSAPLPLPSGGMRNGVMVFHAADAKFALAACQATEAQSRGSALPVTCYPPDTPRFLPGESWPDRIGVLVTSLPPLYLGLSLAAMLAAFGLFYRAAANESPVQALRLASRRVGRRLLVLSRLGKQALLALTDVLALWLALWLAFSLRLETFYHPQGEVVWLFFALPLLAIPVFLRFGLYRAVIRFLGGQAVRVVALAVGSHAVLFALLVLLGNFQGVPRSVLVIYPLLAVLLVGLPRYVARLWLSQLQNRQNGHRERVLIYGAGSAGIQLSAALMHSRELCPVGFVEDDSTLAGNTINGLPVYSVGQLAQVVNDLEVAEILLAVPSATRTRRSAIIDQLEPLPVRVRTLPGLSDLAQGKVRVEDLREVDIEDLLGRDPVSPDSDLLGATITGKVVLVSGAGGSIGSELCRQIVQLRPAALVLYEHGEYALYAIEQELLHLSSPLSLPIYPVLGSVVDQARMVRTLRRYGVQTVFHAAAYKHVPLVERNPIPGVINNIFGTCHAARAALETGVQTFVLISTDKAVRPTNTMGTTKRFAEMILQALHAAHPDQTRFTMVRFGNVLGSSGSVVPLFREQISRGGPVTVTDPRIIRYFMTIPEAAQLVIQAGAMGAGQDVFVLDMGESVKILDLAQRMIHLSGLTERSEDNPDGEIEIVFSGLRPGEKLYEELLIGDNVSATAHPRILRADEKLLPWRTIEDYLERLKTACDAGDSDRVRELLLAAVEEFSPQCGNQDLLN